MTPLKQPRKPFALPLKHGSLQPRRIGKGRKAMTVCIAARFAWDYAYGPGATTQDWGTMILTASDRMLTAGDIEYEPNQLKVGELTTNAMCLVAGDFAVHSEAIILTKRQLYAKPESDTGIIAEIYASHVRAIKFRLVSQLYLSPLGLDENSYQNSPFAHDLANQIQNHNAPECEAIICGADAKETYLYLIDSHSRVTLHNDVGFVAIGIGASHVKSQFTSSRFSKNWYYSNVLALTYLAKKRAEAAPGVGKETDLFLMGRYGRLEVAQPLQDAVKAAYEKYTAQQIELDKSLVTDLQDAIAKASAPAQSETTNQPENPPGHPA